MKINEIPVGHVFKKVKSEFLQHGDKFYLRAGFDDAYNAFDLEHFYHAYISKDEELEDLGMLSLSQYTGKSEL